MYKNVNFRQEYFPSPSVIRQDDLIRGGFEAIIQQRGEDYPGNDIFPKSQRQGIVQFLPLPFPWH